MFVSCFSGDLSGSQPDYGEGRSGGLSDAVYFGGRQGKSVAEGGAPGGLFGEASCGNLQVREAWRYCEPVWAGAVSCAVDQYDAGEL